MLNLKQLVQKTDEGRKERARFVKLTGVKTGHLQNGLGYVACKSYSTHHIDKKGKPVRNTNPQHHITVITFMDHKLNVNVACSCEDNTFRWEVANWYKDASEIEYSNGFRPNVTNPRLKPGLCKHMYALVERIQSKLPPGTV